MEFFKNIKFVRKIQISFLAIAAVAAIIVINDFIQLRKTAGNKNEIYSGYIEPKSIIEDIYAEYNILQFNLLKFSIPSFESDLNINIEAVNKSKSKIDELLLSLTKRELDDEMISSLNEVQATWTNYKNVVADGILSAGVTKNYEMAAIISVTSGSEVGSLLKKKFEGINSVLNKKSDVLSKNVDSNINLSTTFIIIGMILGTIVFLISAFKIAPALSGPINRMKEVIGEFAKGNFDKAIDVNSNDEFGELANALRILQSAQKEKIDAAFNISRGNLVKLNSNSSEDKLAEALNTVVSTLTSLEDELTKLTKSAVTGQLSIRGDVGKFEGSYKEIISGVNETLDAVITPVKDGSEVLTILANGNLTARVNGNYQGDHQIITNSINTVAESLNKALTEVSEAIGATASAATQISSSAEEMAAGSSEQSSQTTDIASAVEEMSKTILETTKNTSIAAETAKNAGKKAKEGGDVVKATIIGMDKISGVVSKSAETVYALGKNSDKIGEIVQVIDDIADQTNLLALNAAIEAARAGEQGRGFAVVADEVRKLAERTTKATKEIAGMIKTIQKDTGEAVQSIQEGTKEVEEGKKLVNRAGEVLKEIIAESNKVSDIVAQVAAASEEQSSGVEQISKNIEGINSITQETASGIQQIAKSAEDLNGQTSNLQALIEKFKLTDKSVYSVRANGKLVIK
ncbi:MAG: methyl-accepting chemotaxis protein [Ignavibacteriales bacterium]|nr:methyl-accepting chemotaxis protein [Ignavibacteriales bacterium]